MLPRRKRVLQALAFESADWNDRAHQNTWIFAMRSTRRYIGLALAFATLVGTTIVQTVPRIEADVHQQTAAIVGNVQSMVVSVSGRDVTLRGRLRTSSPQQMTPAVQPLIDALDSLPSINQLDASVDLLSTDLDTHQNAARAPLVQSNFG